MGRTTLAPGEENPATVVMNLGIADTPLGIIQQHRKFAGLQIQFAEPPAGAVHRLASIGDGMAEILVPMGAPGLAHGKDNLLGLHAQQKEHGEQEQTETTRHRPPNPFQRENAGTSWRQSGPGHFPKLKRGPASVNPAEHLRGPETLLNVKLLDPISRHVFAHPE